VVERILRYMKGVASPVAAPPPPAPTAAGQQELLPGDGTDVPLVLVANDLAPADLLQFKQSVFAGFVTDVGGKTSHTAIVARSMDIPAVVGARAASQLVRQDDWVIIDGDAGVVIVDPSPIILAEYGFRQRQVELERERLARLRHTPAITIDGHKIDYVKGRVAFDLEWNSKDQTFDRDLYALRAFHECGLISAGVMVTRSASLNPVFEVVPQLTKSGEPELHKTGSKAGQPKNVRQKYGASTTWMGKLLYRLNAGRHGGCPVLVFGITPKLISDWNPQP
jgi:phosphohistidine swiveling domain-containing protein